MEFPLQNMNIPRVSSIDAATIAARGIVEALKKPTPNTPFPFINKNNHRAEKPCGIINHHS